MFKTTATTEKTGSTERYVIDNHGEKIYAYKHGAHGPMHYLDTIIEAADHIVVNWDSTMNGWALPLGAVGYGEALELADRRSIVAKIV